MPRFSLALLLLLFPCAFANAASETQTVDVSSAAGVRWEFRPEGGDWKPIQVPAGGWRAQGYTCDAGTYRATVPLPKYKAGETVRLAFAAVNFGAEVSVGADDARLTKVGAHIDGWVPFTANVTPYAVSGGRLRVQVEVRGRKKFMRNGRYTVPEGATWYVGLAEGILRGIALQILPPVHIENAFVQTRIAPDTFQAQADVTNDTAKPQTVRLEAKITAANRAGFRYPKIAPVTVTIPPHTTQTIAFDKAAWTAGIASYWWPNVPYRPTYRAALHLLNITLITGTKITHSLSQKFGFRQFTAISDHYELNGVRCNLRGDNQQEANFGTDAYGIKPGFGAPTRANPGWPQAVDNLLHLNFNVMRIHQIPATPYMLDVCDERGLMLVEESPLRGSESGEEYSDLSRDNMLNMDRELVRRDRCHPAVVIWSAANEWSDPIRDAMKAIRELDDTRPIIADGVGDMGPDVINMSHYDNGGSLPQVGGAKRTDRPYGETESVWPSDNSMQGFAWMATGTRLRRLLGNSDIRNYVLNNAFPNYVPGESDQTEVLEIKVKGNPNAKILPPLADIWNNPNIRLMQQCYNPLAVCDIEFDRRNARSNKKGEWPIVAPHLQAGQRIERKLAIFNDEFNGEEIEFRWEIRQGGKDGLKIAGSEALVTVPIGDYKVFVVAFDAPKMPGDVTLILSAFKDGKERFQDDALRFTVSDNASDALMDGEYRLISANSDLPAGTTSTNIAQNAGDASAQIWTLKRLGGDEFSLLQKSSGLALAIADGTDANGIQACIQTFSGNPEQIWRIEKQDEGIYILVNKATGKRLDVYAASTKTGAKIVQWDANSGDNQLWRLIPTGK